MKKFLFALCAFALALPSVAADNNNIKMVTYFPVPYASYGDLGVTGTCDVGLMGQCKLDAGEGLKVAKASSDSRALNTGSIIVRKGTLGLTPQTSVALGTQLTAGSGTGTGVLEFSHDLAVTSINSSRLAKAQAMNEAQMTSLNMYGHAFPTCDADDHEISWKSLTLGNKTGVFLVCGAGEEAPRTPCPNSCPSGYVRNPEVNYKEDGECCIEQPTVYYFRCTGITSSPVMNTYDSFNDALNACESGANPNAFWVEALPSSRTPMNYQRCGTPENEAYVQSKTAYWYQTLQQLEKPIDPGDITLLQYMRYSCTTSCADCSTGGIGRFFECHCAYGVG